MLLDALFTNGRFTTLDPERPVASSIGVLGGLVVGFDEELHGCRAERVHDLGGAPAVPGFHDAHHHLSARGQDMRMCDVTPSAVAELEGLYDAISRHAQGLAPDAWVLATGYDDDKLGGRPEREALDRAAGGRPTWLAHRSHHCGVVSTEAIRRMGYPDPRDLPDVDGGGIERRDDGNPTGFISERALQLVHRLIHPVPFEEFVEAIELGGRAALADGITSVTEPGICGLLTGNSRDDLAAFATAVEHNRLAVRMTVMPEMAALHELGDTAFGLDLGVRTGIGDDRLRIGAVKLFSDGALTSRTAALRCDYAGRPGDRGLLHEDVETLRRRIFDAHRSGWQIAAHAIGDAAVELVLDAYERAQRKLPRPDPRHRVEHFGLADDALVAKAAELGVIPVPQGRFVTELGETYRANVGRDRADLLFRQKSLLDAGIEVPGSSDCPVVDGSPLLGIHALVTRTLPDGGVLNPCERLTTAQALRAYTTGSAFADHQEHRKGRLSRGKLADFAVLSDDLLTVRPEHIPQLRVQATVVGGVVRHGADALPSA